MSDTPKDKVISELVGSMVKDIQKSTSEGNLEVRNTKDILGNVAISVSKSILTHIGIKFSDYILTASSTWFLPYPTNPLGIVYYDSENVDSKFARYLEIQQKTYNIPVIVNNGNITINLNPNDVLKIDEFVWIQSVGKKIKLFSDKLKTHEILSLVNQQENESLSLFDEGNTIQFNLPITTYRHLYQFLFEHNLNNTYYKATYNVTHKVYHLDVTDTPRQIHEHLWIYKYKTREAKISSDTMSGPEIIKFLSDLYVPPEEPVVIDKTATTVKYREYRLVLKEIKPEERKEDRSHRYEYESEDEKEDPKAHKIISTENVEESKDKKTETDIKIHSRRRRNRMRYEDYAYPRDRIIIEKKVEPKFERVFEVNEKTITIHTTLDHLVFATKNNAAKIVTDFVNGRDKYHAHGMQYTCNFLLYGKPGCGKTSFVRAIANLTKKKVISIKLSQIESDEELAKIFDKEDDDSIYLFEEADTIGILRERTKGNTGFNGKLSLGFILELLDGVREPDGRIVILTTNHRLELDTSLRRRFHSIEFTPCTDKMITDLLFKWFGYENYIPPSNRKEVTPSGLQKIAVGLFGETFETIKEVFDEELLIMEDPNVMSSDSSLNDSITNEISNSDTEQ